MSSQNEVRFLAFTEEGRENVEAAHKLASDNKLKCTWVTVEEVSNLNDSKDSKEEIVYVADPIEGPEVGDVIEHLVSLNYPVLGPQCALTVLKHGIRLQDDLKYPLYTLTMMNTTVCFSNIQNEERDKLVHLVELMGGKVSRPLHCDVTHLVVGEVGSVKYFTAASIDIKIMTKEWIHHLWKHGMSRYICAKDGKWEEFLCPIFLGCNVCMTGFGTTEKTRVQKLVSKFGGEYSGAMKLNYTTHLIVNKPEGQKYAMASKFGVKVVNINWVYDSVEKGSCQDNNKYPVKVDGFKKAVNQSTPESHAKSSRIESMADVSCIDPSMINETVASTMNDTSRMSTIGLPGSLHSQIMLPPASLPSAARVLNPARNSLMSFPMNKDYSEILDGIHVYLAGFLPDEEEKMGKLLSLASAIKYNQLTSSVSCVIIGNVLKISGNLKNDIVTTSAQNPDLRVVNQSWLLESLKKGELVHEKDHWEESIIPIPADHDEIHENDETKMETTTREGSTTTVHDNKSTVKRNPAVRSSTTGNKDMDGSMIGFLLPNDDVDDDEMLSQYMMNPQQHDHEDDDHDDEMRRKQTPEIADTMYEGSSFLRRKLRTDNTNITNMDIDETRPQDNETTEMQSTTMQSESSVTDFFNAKTFFVFGFDAEEMQELSADIESCAGCVLPVNSKKIADYAVVPLTGWPVDRTVQDVVTNFYIKFCIEESRLIETDEHPMCTPFSVPPDSNPLHACVACLSKYRDSERVYLSRLVEELGGLVQEVVARRDTKDLKQTTHLIINEPGGDKYDGCKNWGIVTVTEEWVYESARRGRKQDEDEFSVDKPRKAKEILQEKPKATLNQPLTSSARQAVSRTDVLSKVSKIKSHSYVGWNTEFPPMPRPPSVVDKIRKRLEAKADAEKKAKEDAIKNKETPLRVRYKRLNLETPSKFMTKGGPPVNVSFDLTEVFELLKTPVEQQKKIQEEMKENPETPMSVFLSRCLDEGVKNIPDELIMNLEKKLTEQIPMEDVKNNEEVHEETKQDETSDRSTGSNIFSDLVISLAKKLHNQYSELGKIISKNGGEFRWTYDNACTHFLFQGRLNEKNKEFCTARRDGKYVVSPHWINACVETNSRIDESLFPHVYDPNKSIQMASTSPPKTRRRTLRSSTIFNGNKSSSSKSGNSSNSAESEGETISKKMTKKKEQELDIEVEDSQEARENLRKKLEHIMSATSLKTNKHMHRLSCSRVNTPSPSIAAAQRRTTANTGTPLPMKDLDHDKTELSQDVQVSWDDPTGREEMERLMKENNTTIDDSNFKVPADVSKNLSTTDDGDATHLDEEEAKDTPQVVQNGQIMRFHMSAVSPQEKSNYIEIINQLGGEFLDGGSIDPSATHLLVTKPGRSEKFLSALASGKCIVNSQYLLACKDANRFILEDKYEYGNPLNRNTEEYSKKPDTLQSQISLSPYRWRSKLHQNEKETGAWKGAFFGWKVALHVNDRQMKGFERLLQCGSADVIATQLPQHEKLADITHAFIDPEKAKQLDNSVLEGLVARSGIHVCNPSYIGDYLLKNPPPEPCTHYLPQISSILEKMNQENDEGREAKRRRIE